MYGKGESACPEFIGLSDDVKKHQDLLDKCSWKVTIFGCFFFFNSRMIRFGF